jgi:hypothetical protein
VKPLQAKLPDYAPADYLKLKLALIPNKLNSCNNMWKSSQLLAFHPQILAAARGRVMAEAKKIKQPVDPDLTADAAMIAQAVAHWRPGTNRSVTKSRTDVRS